jgi:hypothetical protein
MVRLGRDAAETDVVAEFVYKAGLIALEIIQDVIHGRKYWERRVKAKRIEREAMEEV